MFTLSDASTDVKKILISLSLIVGAIVAIFILFKAILIVKEIIFPSPPPAPTILFGKLQPQVFPKNVTDKTFTYTVNTLSGNLPTFPNQAKIYRTKQPAPDLLAVKKYDEKAQAVKFRSGYTSLSDKIFQWNSTGDPASIDKTLRINIVNGDFTVTSNYLAYKSITSPKNVPTPDDATKLAQDFLTNMNVLTDDFDLTKTTTNLYTFSNGSLIPATSLSNTQIIEVNFFQKDIDKLPVFYEKPQSSNIRVLVAGGDYGPQVVEVDFNHQAISDVFSTYPIKTSAQAFSDLKNNKSYIGSYTGTASGINITDVSLGYYFSNTSQDFIMPVFIFTGDNGFTAYVPAVTDEWINN